MQSKLRQQSSSSSLAPEKETSSFFGPHVHTRASRPQTYEGEKAKHIYEGAVHQGEARGRFQSEERLVTIKNNGLLHRFLFGGPGTRNEPHRWMPCNHRRRSIVEPVRPYAGKNAVLLY